MNNLYLQCKRLDKDAKLPMKQSSGAAGFDLFANEDAEMWKQDRSDPIGTGISIAIPPGYYGRIAPRSGLAVKHGIDVLAGVIDSDYRGEIKVILLNTDREERFYVKKGDRIAQLIIEWCGNHTVMDVSELDETDRGQSGFGSTGNT